MIEYIIIGENNSSKIKEIIDISLMNYDICYKIIHLKEINHNTNHLKVYIITDEIINNFKTIKLIREKYNDWDSIIIVITKQYQKRVQIYDNRYMVLDIIDSNEKYKERLKNDIQLSIVIFDQKHKMLKYSYKNIFYQIKLKDILYIEKQKEGKNCIIKTIDKEYIIGKNITKIQELLDKRFIKCSRSYIINMEQVNYYDKKENLIKLNDQSTIYEISRNKKTEIINYLRNVE